MSIKPLLLVVTLHPTRPCRAKEWLEKESSTADIITVKRDPPGAPIYGSGGQLYTSAAMIKAVYDVVRAEWKKNEHEFFGLCFDDVVVTAPETPLSYAIWFLQHSLYTNCLGAFNADLQGGDFKDYCTRFWIVPTKLLVDVPFETLWHQYEFPEFEGPWLRYSKVKCCLLPGLRFNHLHSCSGAREYYEGRKVKPL